MSIKREDLSIKLIKSGYNPEEIINLSDDELYDKYIELQNQIKIATTQGAK